MKAPAHLQARACCSHWHTLTRRFSILRAQVDQYPADMHMKIHPVSDVAGRRDFLNLPYALYAQDPKWVPPLRHDKARELDPRHNAFLGHCDYQLFVLKNGSSVIGRIAAFVDRLAVDYWKEPVGLFGYYECVDDVQASAILIRAAEQWLRERSMLRMRGPWSFVPQEWGMVLEGFDLPPVIMAPYNPPYYNAHMEENGLRKVKDLLVYAISGREGYRIPERIMTVTNIVAQRYGIRVRQIDMSRYDEEVRLFMELSNDTIERNWGYTPVTPAEAAQMARELKPVIQPRGALIAEDRNGRPIGFALAIPDVNVVLKGLKGRLLPFGWLKLLRGIPKLNRYRMFALGVIREYHGKGVDSVIYRALYESLYTPDIWMEINYVLEDNAPMNNAIRKLGARPLRKYRVYEKSVSPE